MCEFEDRHPWSEILLKSGYRRDLVGDAYGRLFFVNKRLNRLTSLVGSEPGPRFSWSVEPNLLSLRQLLRALPSATARALGNRLKGLF